MKNITLIPFTKLECDNRDITGSFTTSFDFYYYGIIEFQMKNIQFHAFFLSLFASLLAPLGGLFASGFKRSIEIKVIFNII
jgi:CDP-diglyceride synthetase